MMDLHLHRSTTLVVACLLACALGVSAWVQVNTPNAGDLVYSDRQVTFTWTVQDTAPASIHLYLIKNGTLSHVGRIAKSIPTSDGSVTLNAGWTSTIEGEYYIAVLDGGGSSYGVIGAGPGPRSNFKYESFHVQKWRCRQHSECESDSYCDLDGSCAECSACLYHLDPIDGTCPAQCGGNSLFVGQTLPDTTEEAAVGPVRGFVVPTCSQFDSLVYFDDQDVVFSSASPYARYMTQRMSSKLQLLQGLVDNMFPNFQLQVEQGFTYNASALEPSTFHEGRSLLLTLTPNPTSSDVQDLTGLAVGARFDWIAYVDPLHVRVSVLPDRCRSPLDLIFLLDGSGSIDNERYGGAPGNFKNKVLGFVENVAQYFDIGPNATRIGVATFASRFSVNLHLNSFDDKAALLAAVRDIGYPTGATYTSAGLKGVREQMMTASNGLRDESLGYSRVVVVLTDGQATSGYEPAQEAALLRDLGVTVFAIGIGSGVVLDELNDMATDDQHVEVLKSFARINDIVDSMSAVACDAPTIIKTGTSTESAVSACDVKYYRPQCGRLSNMVVELRQHSGNVHLFASRDNTYPGPFTYQYAVQDSQELKRMVINDGRTDQLFIAVVGASDGDSEFELTVWSDLFDDGVDEHVVSLSEDVEAGVTVFEPSPVVDLGGDYEPNLRYTAFGDLSANFEIDELTGVVTLVAPLDYEAVSTHLIRISVGDASLPCLTGLINVVVNVENVNDNDPGWLSLPPFTASVKESAKVGDPVVQITANDPDGFGVTYALFAGDRRRVATALPFAINATTGLVTVAASLDAETQSTFSMIVQAADEGVPPQTATATLTINVQSVACPVGTYSDSGTFPCNTASKCGALQYIAAAATTTSDTFCGEITPCAGDQYEEQAATTTSNRKCADCTECGADARTITSCTATKDTTCLACTPCVLGVSFEDTPCSDAVDRTCVPCTPCGENEVELEACTLTSDARCEPIVVCNDAQYEIAPLTTSSNRECTPLTQCNSLEEEARAPTATSDRACLPIVVSDPCADSPCLNGGFCSAIDAVSFECECPPNFIGDLCETFDSCAASPCAEGATCVNTDAGATCVCPDGFHCACCNVTLTDACPTDVIVENGQCITLVDAQTKLNEGPTDSPNSSKSASSALIGGIVAGCLFLLLVMVFLAKSIRRRESEVKSTAGLDSVVVGGMALPLLNDDDVRHLTHNYRECVVFDHLRSGRGMLEATDAQLEVTFPQIGQMAPAPEYMKPLRQDMAAFLGTPVPESFSIMGSEGAVLVDQATDVLCDAVVDLLVELGIDFYAVRPNFGGRGESPQYSEADEMRTYCQPGDLRPYCEPKLGEDDYEQFYATIADFDPAKCPFADAHTYEAMHTPRTSQPYEVAMQDEPTYDVALAKRDRDYMSPRTTTPTNQFDEPTYTLASGPLRRPTASYDVAQQNGGSEAVYDMAQLGGERAQEEPTYDVAQGRRTSSAVPVYDMASRHGSQAQVVGASADLYDMAQAGPDSEAIYDTATVQGHSTRGSALYDTATVGDGGDDGPLYDTAEAVIARNSGLLKPIGGSQQDPTYDLANPGATGEVNYDLAGVQGASQEDDDLYAMAGEVKVGTASDFASPVYSTANTTANVTREPSKQALATYDLAQQGDATAAGEIYDVPNVSAGAPLSEDTYSLVGQVGASHVPSASQAKAYDLVNAGPKHSTEYSMAVASALSEPDYSLAEANGEYAELDPTCIDVDADFDPEEQYAAADSLDMLDKDILGPLPGCGTSRPSTAGSATIDFSMVDPLNDPSFDTPFGGYGASVRTQDAIDSFRPLVLGDESDAREPPSGRGSQRASLHLRGVTTRSSVDFSGQKPVTFEADDDDADADADLAGDNSEYLSLDG
eukprot:m.291017 g.291017  ORF g.291017 m.291017 type:complete len:1874 (-) comp15823_c0_seq1:367-5988(-)